MFLGVDVSKATLDAALLANEAAKPRHRVFQNTPEGHTLLLSWLQEQGAGANAFGVHATLEATGTYAEGVALALHQAGHTVSLVNPALVRAFGQSQLKRTKTDKADAQLIARFCAMHKPGAWSPPAPELRELQALVRRVEALEEMKQMEENRLGSGVGCEVVAASLRLRCGFAAASLRLRCGFAAASLRLRCGFAAASLRLRCGFAAASLRLRCGFAAASLRLRCGFAAASLRLRCGFAA